MEDEICGQPRYMRLITGKSGYAKLIVRDNRFVVTCLYQGKKVKAHLPNPGRLWELFFPGVTILLQENNTKGAKLPYTCMAVIKDEKPIFLHTILVNRIAGHLLATSSVPAFAGARVTAREVRCGNSRFDFLLEKEGHKLYVEVKSCSLFYKDFAMFPDAPTIRGTRHVNELTHLADEGTACAILFIIQDPGVLYFLPEYHTDPDFARALYQARHKIAIVPIGISLTENLQLLPAVRTIPVPWHIYEQAGNDSGVYMIVLYLEEDKTIGIGSKGEMFFKKGYYVYAGSAKKNLSSRLKRHGRLRKNLFWHIDYLRQFTRFIGALPVRTSASIECNLAARLAAIAHWIPGPFGNSDCACFSHLFGFTQNPFDLRAFIDLLLYFRMELPAQKIPGK